MTEAKKNHMLVKLGKYWISNQYDINITVAFMNVLHLLKQHVMRHF